MLIARLIALKVLPSPGSALVIMIRLRVIDARRPLEDVAQQRTLDDAEFLGDRRARLVGRDQALLVASIARSIVTLREHRRGVACG
jgi:hypothetical protein